MSKAFSLSRRTALQSLAAAAFLGAGAPLWAQEKLPTIRLGYWTSGVSLGFGSVLEARAQEFFEKNGVHVEFLHFPDVNAPLRALASGSIDLGFGIPLAGVLSSSAAGVPLRIFAATQPADVQFVVPADSPITRIEELRGKKVGMSPAGSSAAVIAQAVLAGNYGITPADFSLVGGNESRLVQFLAQKQVDASALRTVTIEQLTSDLPVRRLSSFFDEWAKLTKTKAVPYLGVAAARAEVIDSHSDVVARILLGLRDALAWGDAHPQEVTVLLTKTANLPEKSAKTYAKLWNSMNRIAFEPDDIATLRRQYEVFAKAGLVKGSLAPALFAEKPYEIFKSGK